MENSIYFTVQLHVSGIAEQTEQNVSAEDHVFVWIAYNIPNMR